MDFKSLSARVKEQKAAMNAARKSDYNCSIIASVGTGKSKVMIDLAIELFLDGKIKNILYLCDNRRLRDSKDDGFPAELNKWGHESFNKIVTLECYQSAYKFVNKKFDLVLGDEIDMALTPEYIKVFLNNDFKYKILVSGTLSNPKRKILNRLAPIVYELKGHEAEQRGVVNKTEYYIYNFKMTEEESRKYQSLTNKIKQLLKIQTPLDDSTLQYWIRTRKGLMNTLDSSTKHCKRIIKFLEDHRKDNRIVVFCERTEQADKVCEYSFHGENEKDDMLTDFQEGRIRKLSVVAKIKRGINLVRTNCCIFESLSGSSTEWEQRSGRLKRLKTNEVAIVVFMLPWLRTIDKEGEMVYKESIVKKWITRATENIPDINFKILKL